VKIRYEEYAWPEIREAVRRDPLVVLPTGTTEQHGPHMPLMVDYLCASEVALRAAELADEPKPLVMQPICYAFNEHHLDFPGTIAIDGDTLVKYIVCIGKSLAHHGFRHILIVNGHGSNVPYIDAAARAITNHTEAICAACFWSAFIPDGTDLRLEVPRASDRHAGEKETSAVLHLRPDLVDMTKAADSLHEPQRSENIWHRERGSRVLFQEFFSRNTSTGIIGNAVPATAEKGKRMVELSAEGLAKFYGEFRGREIRPRRDLH